MRESYTSQCKHYPGSSGGVPVEISELRFNLPTAAAILGNDEGPDLAAKRAHHFLHRHGSSDHSLPDSDTPGDLPGYFDERGNIDLALGQERAGGGFHGKSAKLGKLIIEDMGLRMLDLTVATNLALWWRAYERAN